MKFFVGTVFAGTAGIGDARRSLHVSAAYLAESAEGTINGAK